MFRSQQLVKRFHTDFDLTINSKPTVPSHQDRKLSIELIYEEFLEFVQASGFRTTLPDKNELKNHLVDDLPIDMVKVADGLGDVSVVTDGAALRWGIDLEPVLEEISRSNLSKVGGHKGPNGKWIKPDTYSPADLKSILVANGMEE